MKSRGCWLHPPFGFRVDGDGGLIPDDNEQVIIAQARALRADGVTLRAIQAAMETQYGRKLSLDAPQRVLADTSATGSDQIAPSADC